MSNLLINGLALWRNGRVLFRGQQREEIAVANKNGKYRGRKKQLRPDQVLALKQQAASGEKKTVLPENSASAGRP